MDAADLFAKIAGFINMLNLAIYIYIYMFTLSSKTTQNYIVLRKKSKKKT